MRADEFDTAIDRMRRLILDASVTLGRQMSETLAGLQPVQALIGGRLPQIIEPPQDSEFVVTISYQL